MQTYYAANFIYAMIMQLSPAAQRRDDAKAIIDAIESKDARMMARGGCGDLIIGFQDILTEMIENPVEDFKTIDAWTSAMIMFDRFRGQLINEYGLKEKWLRRLGGTRNPDHYWPSVKNVNRFIKIAERIENEKLQG